MCYQKLYYYYITSSCLSYKSQSYTIICSRMAGVKLQSQEAYEMASRGLVRPEYKNRMDQCVLYSIRSVDWEPPELVIG